METEHEIAALKEQIQRLSEENATLRTSPTTNAKFGKLVDVAYANTPDQFKGPRVLAFEQKVANVQQTVATFLMPIFLIVFFGSFGGLVFTLLVFGDHGRAPFYVASPVVVFLLLVAPAVLIASAYANVKLHFLHKADSADTHRA